MAEKNAEIEARGARLFAIGNGTALMARDFAEAFDVKFPLFTDPSRASYLAAGMRTQRFLRLEGLGATLSHGVRSLRRGFRQGRTQGDPFQNGGVLVVEPSGRILFSQAEAAAGDLADPDAVVAGLPAHG